MRTTFVKQSFFRSRFQWFLELENLVRKFYDRPCSLTVHEKEESSSVLVLLDWNKMGEKHILQEKMRPLDPTNPNYDGLFVFTGYFSFKKHSNNDIKARFISSNTSFFKIRKPDSSSRILIRRIVKQLATKPSKYSPAWTLSSKSWKHADNFLYQTSRTHIHSPD